MCPDLVLMFRISIQYWSITNPAQESHNNSCQCTFYPEMRAPGFRLISPGTNLSTDLYYQYSQPEKHQMKGVLQCVFT